MKIKPWITRREAQEWVLLKAMEELLDRGPCAQIPSASSVLTQLTSLASIGTPQANPGLEDER